MGMTDKEKFNMIMGILKEVEFDKVLQAVVDVTPTPFDNWGLLLFKKGYEIFLKIEASKDNQPT